MDGLLIIGALVALAVAVTVRFGLRDGWLKLSPSSEPSPLAAAIASSDYAATVRILKFEAVRKRIGYRDANAIVKALAERIAADARCELGRIGRTSIEFLYRAADENEARRVAAELRDLLQQPVAIDSLRYDPLVSIGCNRLPPLQGEEELFDLSAWAADEAAGRPERISFVHPHQHAELIAQSSRMFPDLAEAVRSDRLELHYLPKLRLADGTITGAEALCRWTHPRHGPVPPMEFIRLAEETGLIRDLTLWTLDRAAADQARLRELGYDLAIDVNLSGVLVGDPGFCELVLARVQQAPGRIGLEITETSAIEDPVVGLANLNLLADAGVHLAIDDFGAGLSSLSYLRDLPAHELKIDQSFIRSLTTSNKNPLLVRSAIEIARALEMDVTAEGVEDELALRLLTVMRCNSVQGFHISQPLPLEQLIEFLRRDNGVFKVTGEQLSPGLAKAASSAA